MKDFNLEQALAGAKVITRDGREVTDLHLFKIDKRIQDPLYGVMQDDGDTVESWNLEGKFLDNGNKCIHDLFMAPTERTEWIVRQEYYPEKYIVHGPFTDIEAAQRFVLANGGTIHEIKIIE